MYFILLCFVLAQSSSSPKNSPISRNDVSFEIYEHPSCSLETCLESIDYLYGFICQYEITGKEEYCYHDFFMKCKYYFSQFWDDSPQKYGLTEEEALSVCVYTRSSHELSTNDANYHNPREFGCFTDYLNSALYKIMNYTKHDNDSKEVKVLFMGTSGDSSYKYDKTIDINGSPLVEVGDILTLPSYGSASDKFGVAFYFATGRSQTRIVPIDVIYIINTLGYGTNAVYINKVTCCPDQNEYIYYPLTRFRITNTSTIDNILYIYMDELNTKIDGFRNYLIDPKEEEYFSAEKKCSGCGGSEIDYCKNCATDGNTCIECYAGYTINSMGKCIKCSEDCMNCLEENIDNCTQCYKGYGLVNGKCLSCESKGCSQCDDDVSICKECLRNYTLIEGKCVLCSDNSCEKCSSEEKCISCYGKSILENGKCSDCGNKKYNNDGKCELCQELPNCETCENLNDCSICEKGYFESNGECKKCDDINFNCNDCFGETDCFDCNDGYYLMSVFTHVLCGNCEYVSTGCIGCTNSSVCLKCDSHYYLEDDKCYECSENCKVCNNELTCLECEEMYEIDNNGKCLKKDTSNCDKSKCCECNGNKCKDEDLCQMGYTKSEDGNCSKCIEYYKVEGNECIQNVVGCGNDFDHCTKCVETAEGKDKMCIECEKDYSLHEGRCEKYTTCSDAKEKCQYCFGEEGKGDCVVCENGYKLRDNNCEETQKCSTDKEGCYECFKDGSCANCLCGYHLDGKKCKKGNVLNSANLMGIIAIIGTVMIFI